MLLYRLEVQSKGESNEKDCNLYNHYRGSDVNCMYEWYSNSQGYNLRKSVA